MGHSADGLEASGFDEPGKSFQGWNIVTSAEDQENQKKKYLKNAKQNI